MVRRHLFRFMVAFFAALVFVRPAIAHTNISLTIDNFTPTNGPAGVTTTIDFTYRIFHVGHNPPINNVWRILRNGTVVVTGGNNHANTGSGNETYTENENVLIPLGSAPGVYTITVQTLHSPSGTNGCNFNTNNACRRTATVTYTIPDESDMSIDLSGLPTTADLNQPYTGSFTCTNDATSTAPATSATCAVSGLPAGVTVGTCSPVPPATVAIGASITCPVSGAPTATGVANVVGTTGATNDVNGGTGTGGNNQATTTVTVSGSDMSPDLSGLPVATIVGTPYSGSFSCTNGGPNTALSATCSVSGLPAGVTLGTCTPAPPASVANAASITCTVSGTPTATTTATVTVTTGANNDSNGGAGTGGNNQASATIPAAAIDTTKLASVSTALGNNGSITDAGDQVSYTITVENTGTATLTNVNIVDTLTRIGGGALSLDAPPTPANVASLASGATATFTATYTLVQADIDAGGVSNTATGRGTSPGGTANDVTDVSDDDVAPGGNDPTVSTITPTPILTITKVADDDTLRAAGETITYTYTVTNTGNVAVTNATVSDVHNGSGPVPTPGNETLFNDVAPPGDSTDAATNGSWDTIAPGDSVRFTATYLVTQNDVDSLQ